LAFEAGRGAPSIERTSLDAIDSHRLCATDWKPLSPISAARSGRSIRNCSASTRASAVGSTTRPLTPCLTKCAGIETGHHRLSRMERLDHDQPVVLLHGHERHRQRAGEQLDELLVADAP